jgi:hypothetical protein
MKIEIDFINLTFILKKITRKIRGIFLSFFSSFSNRFQRARGSLFRRRVPKIRLRAVILVFCVLALGGFYYRFFRIPKSDSQTEDNLRFSQTISVGKTLKFPALIDSGKYQGEISLTVVSAEKTNEVLVQNKPVRAKQGKFFLIVDLELENESTKTLGLVSSDLIRLVAGGNGKRIAPDLHNKQVLISPVSVKSDRVGFVVTAPENISLALELGEFYKTREIRERVDLNF